MDWLNPAADWLSLPTDWLNPPAAWPNLCADEASPLADEASLLADKASPPTDKASPYIYIFFSFSKVFAFCQKRDYYNQNQGKKVLILRSYVNLLNYIKVHLTM